MFGKEGGRIEWGVEGRNEFFVEEISLVMGFPLEMLHRAKAGMEEADVEGKPELGSWQASP